MAHTIRHRPANRSRRSKRELRRLHLRITWYAQVCECCGLALWGRRYTNAALQRVCRDCFLCGLPASESLPSPDSAMASSRLTKESEYMSTATQETGLVPYSFTGITDYPRSQQVLTVPGQAQGVYITLVCRQADSQGYIHRTSDNFQFILDKMMGWFRDRDEVELIDHGISDKVGQGYIILEWIECEVDPLFLAILRDEDTVEDYTVYTRDL
jgi:hypothetical protein